MDGWMGWWQEQEAGNSIHGLHLTAETPVSFAIDSADIVCGKSIHLGQYQRSACI